MTVRLFMILLLLFFCACSRLEKHPENGLRIQLPTEPASLDFSLAEDGSSMRVLSGIMTGLDEMAEKIEVLDGGKKYRVRLKSWKWSDGKPVVAQDFLFAFRRTLSPVTPSKLADLLYFIAGARDFKSG